MTAQIDHYDGLDGTPAAAIALRGMAELLALAGSEQLIGLHWSYPAITASIDGKVVGVIVWIDQVKESKRICLQLGYVVPERRAEGIYGQLWRALVEKARELKCPAICSATRVDNYRMREVAKKQGRTECAISLRYDVPAAP